MAVSFFLLSRMYGVPVCVCNKCRGFYAKTKCFSRVSLKQGLRVDLKEIEGGFRKIARDDVRPEAIGALLVGKDMCLHHWP